MAGEDLWYPITHGSCEKASTPNSVTLACWLEGALLVCGPAASAFLLYISNPSSSGLESPAPGIAGQSQAPDFGPCAIVLFTKEPRM